ncbi:YtpR family tRNA-binding protein [Salinicoccus halitifaciens]|uniref:tRNA-binding protein n=1 Tax=Salinicoccus halitifaciens TaxID=1073415 RepID=A0ABV2E7I1_9STAP|nr:DUF4479 domain-containing protein [Salinicoccus halitifaciens]MCD2137233.1 DUF4479 domain-containing protein [Salinicoccus halitifaciens]
MKLTYNEAHVGDVLFVSLESAESPSYTHHGDVTVIKEGDKITGLNIFKAAEKFDLEGGAVNVTPTEAHLDKINEILKSVGEPEIDADLSPKFIVGHVEEKSQHPDADKLSVCKVDVGDETLNIVCGAPNVEAGQKVVVARVGAWMPDGLHIRPSKLRGVESSGMICSKKELNLEDDGVDGIYVLGDDYETGQPFEVK